MDAIRRLLLLLPVLVTLAACRDDTQFLELNGHTMGTSYQVRLVDEPDDPEALRRRIVDELETIDRQMSTWRDDSQISRFNRLRDTSWFPVSTDLGRVLSRALELSATTGGALDITLRPLALAWGFQGDAQPRPPAPPDIETLLAHAGMHRLEVAADGTAVRKQDPHLEIDVSSIAKGYAVDRLADLVRTAGGRNFLVEIGGEVRAAGERPGGGPWRVAVQSPGAGDAGGTVLALRDEAVATSGDYRNYFELDGRRYAHVLNPVTGRPAESGTAVATVVAGDAMTADALATAFMVMEPASALALADRLGVGARLVTREADRLASRENEAFRARLAAPR